MTWEENVMDLEDRNASGRVFRSAHCRDAGTTVQELKSHRLQALQRRPSGNRPEQSRAYATRAYTLAVGGVEEAFKANENRQKAWEAKNKDAARC